MLVCDLFRLRTDDAVLHDAHLIIFTWHYIPSICQRKELCFKLLAGQ